MIPFIKGLALGIILSVVGLRANSWQFWLVLVAFAVSDALGREDAKN